MVKIDGKMDGAKYRTILEEHLMECKRPETGTEILFSYFVKSMFFLFGKNVLLDPQVLFKVDQTLTQQDVRTSGSLCVDKLMDQGSPALEMIKKQAYFDMNYKSRRNWGL
uniref:Uncharacterized protein n=1 Tax=Oncorhynchus mykiss TaxID=8022 RepID=A0A8K9Y6L9_ONCMY